MQELTRNIRAPSSHQLCSLWKGCEELVQYALGGQSVVQHFRCFGSPAHEVIVDAVELEHELSLAHHKAVVDAVRGFEPENLLA